MLQSFTPFPTLDEIKKEKEFYHIRGLVYPKPNLEKPLKDNNNQVVNADANSNNHNFHTEDEQVGIELITSNEKVMQQIPHKFIRLSSQATIIMLKKFLALQLFKDMDRHKEVIY